MTSPTSAAEPYIPRRARPETARKVLLYGVYLVVAAIFLTPFVWTVVTSFKTLNDSLNFNLIPHPWTTAAWTDLWTNPSYHFPTYIKNSLFLAAVIVTCNLFLSALGGYAFARLKFPGREVLFMLVLGTLMIPDQLRLVPIYLMLVNWIPGWVGHLGWHGASFVNRNGVILINLVSATSLFLMRQYFLTIPRDLEEAAKLDAAGYFKTYRKVMLPLAGPALAAVGILTFQGTWNGLFWSAVLLQDSSQYTIPIGLANFHFAYQTLWPPLMAASVLAILPILAIFIVFQRYFVAGVAAAGVKG